MGRLGDYYLSKKGYGMSIFQGISSGVMKTAIVAAAICGMSVSSVAQDNTAPASQVVKPFMGDITFGSKDAKVEIIEYASLTCGACGHFAKHIFPRIEEDYIKTGKIRFIIRHLLRDRVDLAASVIARCGTEEQAKSSIKKFLDRQDKWLKSKNLMLSMHAIALTEGVSKSDVDSCLQNRELQQTLINMTQKGHQIFEVKSTPTLILNGEKIAFKNYADLQKLIDEAVK